MYMPPLMIWREVYSGGDYGYHAMMQNFPTPKYSLHSRILIVSKLRAGWIGVGGRYVPQGSISVILFCQY